MRGRAKVIAIKESVDLCPWADAVYGCDAAWWRFRRGLPEFSGFKITWSGNHLDEYPDLARVKIAPGRKDKFGDGLIRTPGTVGGGGNSGFQALNLAVQFGAARIILIGFDMVEGGKHWYGRNHWPMSNNPDKTNFKRWIGALEGAAPMLKAWGVTVLNASPSSALKSYPVVTIEQALA